MSGIAELLHSMGARVSGSDTNSDSPAVQRLKTLGIRVFENHSADHIQDLDVVVYSSAVALNNPELVRARELRIPTIQRAEALSEIMRLKRGIAIAGSHGKTTTTSIVSSVLLSAGLDPTIVVGGRFARINSNSRFGLGEWLVAEADESDGSFKRLSPEIAVITNIDNDHLDFYGNFRALEQAFLNFADKIPFFGHLIVCGDDPVMASLFKDYNKPIVTYGFSESCDYRLEGASKSYRIFHGGNLIGKMSVSVPGRHNALNSLAAFVVGLKIGLSPEQSSQGVAEFSGVDRRFQHKGSKNGVQVYDDYGHHPTEIAAVLEAARSEFPNQRLRLVFQPHRYSRLQSCWDQFLSGFNLADEVYISDVYAAGERAIPGVDSQSLVQSLLHKGAHYLPHGEGFYQTLWKSARPGDILVFMGAGNIWKWSNEFLEAAP